MKTIELEEGRREGYINNMITDLLKIAKFDDGEKGLTMGFVILNLQLEAEPFPLRLITKVPKKYIEMISKGQKLHGLCKKVNTLLIQGIRKEKCNSFPA